MARPKEFDPEQALDRAVGCFWRQGYEGTSIGDLTDELGIARASLYGTFGSKDELYDRALERYQEQEGARARGCLDADAPPLDRVDAFLRGMAETALGDRENRGCFVLNAAMERPHDAATAARVRAGLKAMEDALARVLSEARDDGSLAEHRDPRALARFLVTASNGARVTAKATRDPAVVRDAVDVALAVLR